MDTLTYDTLEHIAQQARPYPTRILDGQDTGLLLFAAAFLGHNDAIHFAMRNLTCTCVDLDGDRLMEMARLYPSEWDFLADDAFQFAYAAANEEWDIVSVDTFTGSVMDESLESLGLWCRLARHAVTVTVTADALGSYQIPTGWKASLHERSDRVYWLVLERE